MTIEQTQQTPRRSRQNLLKLAAAAMQNVPDLREGSELGGNFRTLYYERSVDYHDDSKAIVQLYAHNDTALVLRRGEELSVPFNEGIAFYDALGKEELGNDGVAAIRDYRRIGKNVDVSGTPALVMLGHRTGATLDSTPYAAYDVTLRRRLPSGLYFAQKAGVTPLQPGGFDISELSCKVSEADGSLLAMDGEARSTVAESFPDDVFSPLRALSASACQQLILA
jgi:hypothetical protein